ncbi:MAG TPA: hypothetical protein DEB40_12130 [Elusimicrobia bacterium]|nr:hypothetical protein [Elusimicrobiota bacterium]HBT62482.1 hypothetical protein [Elusimicrobiota bacterium]
MIFRCPNCGAEVTEDSHKCPFCGCSFDQIENALSEARPDAKGLPRASRRERAAPPDPPPPPGRIENITREITRLSSRLQAEPPIGLWVAGTGAFVALVFVAATCLTLRSDVKEGQPPETAASFPAAGPKVAKKDKPGSLPKSGSKIKSAPAPSPARVPKPASEPINPAPPVPRQRPAHPAARVPAPRPALSIPSTPSPRWIFLGQVYDLISLQPISGAQLTFRDASGNVRGSTITRQDGGYRIALPSLRGGSYALAVKHQDYQVKYIDEISPPFKEVSAAERRQLADLAARARPWIGKTNGSTQRDFVMILKDTGWP